MRFCRSGKRSLRVVLDLAGDFHEDICGKVIRLSNPHPSDKNARLNREGTYMEGFSAVQSGAAGDITAGISRGPWTDEIASSLMLRNEEDWESSGIHGGKRERLRREFLERYAEQIRAGAPYFPYTAYPYIEWVSDANGRVVLELEPSQVVVLGEESSQRVSIPRECVVTEEEGIRKLADFFSRQGFEVPTETTKREGNGPGSFSG